MYKLLLIEDDQQICDKLSSYLIRWGHEVAVVEDFKNILDTFTKVNPELVLMDINLSYYDGFYWCQQIRQVSSCPILFLSSRNQDMDMIMAIHAGGDDYITKPFSTEVLNVKIKALLRRSYDYQPQQSNGFTIRGALYNSGNLTLTLEGQRLELTKNEGCILTTLHDHKGQIVSRDILMNALWNDDQFVNDNTLTVNINRLRKKLEEIGLVGCIQTKKGKGYCLDDTHNLS